MGITQGSHRHSLGMPRSFAFTENMGTRREGAYLEGSTFGLGSASHVTVFKDTVVGP
jgi:hypothetical protein